MASENYVFQTTYRSFASRNVYPGSMYMIGILPSLMLLPTAFSVTKEGQYVYCLFTIVVLYLTEAIPVQMTAFVPLMLISVFGIMEPYNSSALYLSASVLSLLASLILVISMDSTRLYSRCALRLMGHYGTQVRSLLLSLAAVSFVLALFLNTSVASFLVIFLSTRAISIMELDSLQPLRSRADLRMAATQMPERIRQQVETCLLDDPLNLDAAGDDTQGTALRHGSYSELPLSSVSVQARASEGAVITTETAAASPSLSIRSVKSTGTTNVSGEPDQGRRARRHIRKRASLRQSGGALRDVVVWETTRYYNMQRDLLYCVTVSSIVASMINLEGNSSHRYFLKFVVQKFRGNVLSMGSWLSIVTPVMAATAGIGYLYINARYLDQYDCEEDEHIAKAVRNVVMRVSRKASKMKYTEYLPLVLFLLWIFKESIFIQANKKQLLPNIGPVDFVSLDWFLILVMYSLPKPVPGRTASYQRMFDFSRTVRRVPWGAVFIFGSRVCMKAAWIESGFVHWVDEFLHRLYDIQGPVTTQIVLVFLSSVLTEILSSDYTVRLLLPVAIDIGIHMPYNPLYFGIPVAVAASTTLIMPTAATPLAIIHDIVDIGPRDTFTPGIIFKGTTLVALVVVMNTIGEYAHHWAVLPRWMSNADLNFTFVAGKDFIDVYEPPELQAV